MAAAAASAPIERLTVGRSRFDLASSWKRQHPDLSIFVRGSAVAQEPPPISAFWGQAPYPPRRRGLCRTSDQANIVRSGRPALRHAGKKPPPLQTTAERRGHVHI